MLHILENIIIKTISALSSMFQISFEPIKVIKIPRLIHTEVRKVLTSEH